MPDDSGNVIPVRIDVAGLEGDVAKVREIFAELFNSLKQYSSQSIAPIAVSGLTELNTSIKQTNISLSQLTDKLNGLSAATTRNSSLSNKNIQSVTQQDEVFKQWAITIDKIFQSQAKLIVQQQEEAKTLATLNVQIRENDKALKADANTIAEITALEKELANADSAETQRITELKVAIAEKNRILKESAQLQNADYQARMKVIADEKAAEDADKARKQRQKKYAADIEAAKKKAAKISADEDAARKKAAKTALEEANAYDRLKASIKQLQNEYVKLIQAQISGGKTQKQAEKSPEAKAKLKEIEELTVSSKRFGEQFGEAGSEGIAKWGKGLTGIFSQIRTLAYILPGIGIAGIFNLIFEAIEYCVSELLDFNRTVKATVDYNNELAKSSQLVVDALIGIANALDSTKAPMLDYLKNQKAAAEARGENFAQLIPETKAVLIEEKKNADDRVKNVRATKESIDKLNNDIILSERERLGIQGQINDYDAKINEIKHQNVLKDGVIIKDNIKNYVLIKKYTGQRDIKKEALAATEATISAARTLQQEQISALKNQTAANDAIRNEDLKDQKYFADESVRITAASAKQIYETSKTFWERQLRDRTSTQEQQIEAINKLNEIEINNAKAHYQEVVSTVGVSSSQVKQAEVDLAVATIAINDKKNQQISDNQMDWDLRRIEALKKIAVDELEIQSRKNQAVFEDTKNSLNQRINALYNYSNIQKAIILKDFEVFKQTEKYRNLLPEEKRAEEFNIQKRVGEVDFVNIEKMRSVTSSFINERIRLLKENDAAVDKSTDVEEQYSIALTEINKRYSQGLISFKAFEDARKKAAQSETIDTDITKIEGAKVKINNIQNAIAENQLKIQSAALSYTMKNSAADEDAQKAAKARYDTLLAGGKEMQSLLDDAYKELRAAELKRATDEAAIVEARGKLEKTAKDQTVANWKKAGEETLSLFGEVMDNMYEKRIEQVQKNIELIDRQYEHEIDAIERSSLADKDRTALTIQLKAQEERANEEAAKKERKLKHDQALWDKATAISKIIWDTEQAIAKAFAEAPIGVDVGLAVSYAALGAIALARAAAAPVPALALGTEDWRGGMALVGEVGRETIKEPHKQPYSVSNAQIMYLPKGTEVVPEYSIPAISQRNRDNSWEQTRFLASVFQKGNKATATKLINHVHIDAEWLIYKQKILYGNHT
jgi:hypothetical protein